jgi:hypothetical protein
MCAVADPGDGGDKFPTGLKHRGLERSLYVKTENFSALRADYCSTNEKNKYNNVTGKCQNCRELQQQYFLHAWG